MKHKFIILSIILLITSCASSRRLKRVFKEDRSKAAKEADRVNAFPLFYVNGDSGSLLWPLMDADSKGFSIRPFFNKEGNEYAALFPLSAWNPVKGDGWVGPLYWDKDKSVLFPLYYRDKNHLQVLTYYQSKNSASLFPFFYKDNDTLQVLTYFAGKNSSVLFPLFYKDQHNMQLLTYFSGDDYSCMFPLFYKEKRNSGYEGFYTLLGGYSKDKNSSSYMASLLWWSGESKTGSYKTLLPIFHHSQKGLKENTYLFPWCSSKDENSNSKMLIPLYSSKQKFNKKGEMYQDQWQFPMLIPLAGKETTGTGSRTSSLAGFLFDHEVKGNSSQGDILFCLADWESDENKGRFRFPAIFNLTGLIDISHEEDTSKVNLLIYSHEKKPNSVKRDIFPFMTWDSGQNESGFSFLWRLFETHDRNGRKGGHIFFIPYGA